MKSCTCIEYEDQGIIPDPECPEHRREEETTMGAHDGERKSFREAIKPPEKFNRKQRVSWYVGLFIGAVLVCAALGMVLGLIIGLVRWLTLVWLWLVGA